jgi:hypothetical protein
MRSVGLATHVIKIAAISVAFVDEIVLGQIRVPLDLTIEVRCCIRFIRFSLKAGKYFGGRS